MLRYFMDEQSMTTFKNHICEIYTRIVQMAERDTLSIHQKQEKPMSETPDRDPNFIHVELYKLSFEMLVQISQVSKLPITKL